MEAFIRGPLIVSGDAAATAHNILGSELLYRGASALDLLVLFCDTCVALLLYVLLRPAGRNAALLAAFFRLVFVAIMGVDGLLYFAPLTLLQSRAGAFSTGQLQVLAMTALKLQGTGFNIALVFFGVHCILVGVLIAKSRFLPRAIGVLMAIAGACYLVNSFNNFLPHALSAPLFPFILLPGLVGEASLAVWLTVFGVNARKWAEQPGAGN